MAGQGGVGKPTKQDLFGSCINSSSWLWKVRLIGFLGKFRRLPVVLMEGGIVAWHPWKESNGRLRSVVGEAGSAREVPISKM